MELYKCVGAKEKDATKCTWANPLTDTLGIWEKVVMNKEEKQKRLRVVAPKNEEMTMEKCINIRAIGDNWKRYKLADNDTSKGSHAKHLHLCFKGLAWECANSKLVKNAYASGDGMVPHCVDDAINFSKAMVQKEEAALKVKERKPTAATAACPSSLKEWNGRSGVVYTSSGEFLGYVKSHMVTAATFCMKFDTTSVCAVR